MSEERFCIIFVKVSFMPSHEACRDSKLELSRGEVCNDVVTEEDSHLNMFPVSKQESTLEQSWVRFANAVRKLSAFRRESAVI